MTDQDSLETGTTTVGLLGDDHVILATDKRASMGKYIAWHDFDKITSLTDHLAITTAGTVSTIQFVEKVVKARLRLKDLNSRRKTTVKEAANLITNINFRNARTPFPEIASFFLGGYDDEEGAQLFNIAPDGTLVEIAEENGYYAGGSGRMMAMGLLEQEWEQGLSSDEAADLARQAIDSAVKRDAGSGSGVLIAKIDSDGFTELTNTSHQPTVKEQ